MRQESVKKYLTERLGASKATEKQQVEIKRRENFEGAWEGYVESVMGRTKKCLEKLVFGLNFFFIRERIFIESIYESNLIASRHQSMMNFFGWSEDLLILRPFSIQFYSKFDLEIAAWSTKERKTVNQSRQSVEHFQLAGGWCKWGPVVYNSISVTVQSQ